MFFFVLRRLLVSLPILLASSLLVFGLVTLSGDPLGPLRQSTSPNRDQQMAQMSATLGLDKPFFERYFSWLEGVVPIEFTSTPLFIRWDGLDFGSTREGQDVYPLLREAMLTSFRLVLLATALAVLLGIVVGIFSAARQYSSMDYLSTFIAFLCFSLPVFWIAVLLKEFGAIKVNDFLENPGISPRVMVIFGLLAGLLCGSVIGGSWRRRITAGVIAGGAMYGLLALADATDWLSQPGISIPVLAALSLGGAVLAAMAFAPLSARPVLVSALVAAALAVVGSILFDGWLDDPSWRHIFVLTLLAIALGAGVGALAGAIDRRDAMKAGVSAALFVGVLVFADRFISAFAPSRVVGTIGPQTPNFEGSFWERLIDYTGHQILPSLALMLIGFATFMRFTRASMLETLRSDYVRTAKAKGLPATQVVLRHAFRTALIPVVTVATISFATVIEGAVITETVFGWQGMGRLFVDGLNQVDPYPVMGFLLIVSLSIILMNAIADLMYAVLDPRIRND
jgi:peptide/nickel transport system permease protein